MNFKVFIAIFGTLLAVQASNQSPVLQDDSIKEIVVAVYEKVLAKATILLSKANALVDDLDNNKDQVEATIVNKSVEIADKLNADFLKLVDHLKDGATDDGKAVLACIDAQEDKVDADLKKSATEIGSCVAGEHTVVASAVRAVLRQLNDFVVEIQGQVETLTSCSSNEIVCLLAFASSEIETAKKVPAVVVQDLHKALELLHTIKNDVSGCSTQIVLDLKSNIQDLFNDAVVCIKQ